LEKESVTESDVLRVEDATNRLLHDLRLIFQAQGLSALLPGHLH
jgi:hypothetical protein